jgi:hypothetical protein
LAAQSTFRHASFCLSYFSNLYFKTEQSGGQQILVGDIPQNSKEIFVNPPLSPFIEKVRTIPYNKVILFPIPFPKKSNSRMLDDARSKTQYTF